MRERTAGEPVSVVTSWATTPAHRCFEVPRDDLAFATRPFKIIMKMVEYSIVLFSIANHGKWISKNYNIHMDLGIN